VKKQKKTNASIRFEVINILDDLSKTNILKEHSYSIILDSAVFHEFSDEDRQHYIKNLEYLIKPGGYYIQIVGSDKEIYVRGRCRIKTSELNKLFSSKNGWTIESTEDDVYESKFDSSSRLIFPLYRSLITRNKVD